MKCLTWAPQVVATVGRTINAISKVLRGHATLTSTVKVGVRRSSNGTPSPCAFECWKGLRCAPDGQLQKRRAAKRLPIHPVQGFASYLLVARCWSIAIVINVVSLAECDVSCPFMPWRSVSPPRVAASLVHMQASGQQLMVDEIPSSWEALWAEVRVRMVLGFLWILQLSSTSTDTFPLYCKPCDCGLLGFRLQRQYSMPGPVYAGTFSALWLHTLSGETWLSNWAVVGKGPSRMPSAIRCVNLCLKYCVFVKTWCLVLISEQEKKSVMTCFLLLVLQTLGLSYILTIYRQWWIWDGGLHSFTENW